MRRLINKLDKVLLISSIILFGFGLFMIFDASSFKSISEGLAPTHYLFRQVLFLGLSLFGTIIIILYPTRKYKKWALPVAVIITILLILLFVFGAKANGARSWFPVGPFTVQPSEFAKIAIIIFSAFVYGAASKNPTLNNFKTSYAIIAGAIMTGLTVAQPDAGTGMILFIITTSLYFMSPVPIKHKLRAVLIGGAAIVTVFVLVLIIKGNVFNSMQLARFNFLKPCTRYQENTGYQVCNGYIAINNGKLISISPGNSKQKYLYLPEAYTDFIFPIIVEEFGLIPAILIILIYILIIYRIILIGKRATNVHNQILCYGVAVFLFSHIIINLVGVLGILPLTGVPLPFLSYGGSFALTVSAALAIVQRVSIENYDSLKKKVLN